MSTLKYVDELREGLHATNTRTHETVDLIGKLTLDNGVEIWVVEGENLNLYMEYSYNLENPYYWG